MNTTHNPSAPKPALTLIGLLKPYSGWIAMLILFTILSNAFNLAIPTIIARGIDAYTLGHFVLQTVIVEFTLAALAVFVFGSIQNIIQTYASERVARDLRAALSEKISVQSYAFVQGITPGKLLTNLTSDVDAVKQFVAMAVATMVSSVFLIIGASVLLLILDWKLAIAVLAILPVIMITFFLIFRKIRVLFKRTQEIIDWLNKVINESILGSALIRVLNSQQQEADKFLAANTDARNVGLSILRLFASLVPVISFVGNFAVLIILVLGGHFVITGAMTLGSFAAFNAYLAILIFPIVIIGFISTIIARSTASYKRITDVLESEERKETGTIKATIEGAIEVKNVSVLFGERAALKDISFSVQPHTKTAIIGPTGAGKTQLLYILTGLIQPSSGTVLYDGHPLTNFDTASFHRQVGLVFEDSVLFNMSLKENIAFGTTVKEEDLQRAIETAELQDFVMSLPQKLETIVTERGTSLSGGQKQRIMLARALALNPRVLLLDDFTARVDTQTEQKILANVAKNYPEITLVSITQKIASVEGFDHIVLLMEGELLAQGTHRQLMESSPEYVQIADSQRSTSHL